MGVLAVRYAVWIWRGFILYELKKTDRVKQLIEITKSNSGITGPELAKAHIELGSLLAEEMNYPADDTTVVAILRGGIFLAQGIYFTLGCKFEIYDPKSGPFVRPNTKHVIVVDSVINSGKTIFDIATPDIDIACGVINANTASSVKNNLYAVRVSENSFVGSNVKKQHGNIGPDTTMRLFNLL